jgi:hypothetical protein
MISLDFDAVDRLIEECQFEQLKNLVEEHELDLMSLTKITRKLRSFSRKHGHRIERNKGKSFSTILAELDYHIQLQVLDVVGEAGKQVTGPSDVSNPMRAQVMSGEVGDALMASWLIANLITEDPVAVIKTLSRLGPRNMGDSMKGLEKGLVGNLELLSQSTRTDGSGFGLLLDLELGKAKADAKLKATMVWMKGIQLAIKDIIEKGISLNLSRVEYEFLTKIYLTIPNDLSPADIRYLMNRTGMTKKEILKLLKKSKANKDRKKEVKSVFERVKDT